MGRVLRDSVRVGDHYGHGQQRFSCGRWEREEGKDRARAYYFNGAVPRAGDEGVFGGLVPEHGESLPFVLVVVHHRICVDADIE